MKLTGKHKKAAAPATPASPPIVPNEQFPVPTKSTKALVAAVITLAGLVGIHLTAGTAQLIVMLGQLVVVTYGVWRAHNRAKLTRAQRERRNMERYL